jgi:hypothetical protein
MSTSTITIYNWSSGISGVNATGISGYYKEDRVHFSNFNRPIRKLYDNDVSIVKSISYSVITDKIYTNSIIAKDENNLTFTGNVTVYGSLLVSGLAAQFNASQVTIRDNVITLNSGATEIIEGGIEIDRGSLEMATLIYNEASKIWNFSHSGISAKSIDVTNTEVDYIIFNKQSSIVTPASTDINLYVNADGIPAYKDYDSNITLLGGGYSRYNIFIPDQTSFTRYFGHSALTGTGSTIGGYHYSKIGGNVYIKPHGNDKILLNRGNFNLSTSFKLSSGFILHGLSQEETNVYIGYNSVIFTGKESTTKNVEFDKLNIIGSNISLSNNSLFNLNGFKDSIFNNSVESVVVSSIYTGTGRNNSFGDCKNNSSIVFRNLSYARIQGNYDNNTLTFSNVTNTILDAAIIGSDLYDGIGDWDF